MNSTNFRPINRIKINRLSLRILFFVSICLTLISATGCRSQKSDRNLALSSSVTAYADTEDSAEFAAKYAIDGNADTRWSSINDWENSEHYLMLDFGGPTTVSYMTVLWERRNAMNYRIESSSDGQSWDTVISYDTPCKTKKQDIIFPEAVTASMFRIHILDVEDIPDTASHYYQNISIYEIEAYEKLPIQYSVPAPTISVSDASRQLILPAAPNGYSLSIIGADLEQVVSADGTILSNISDMDISLGLLLAPENNKSEEIEAELLFTVPAATLPDNNPLITEAITPTSDSTQINEIPTVLPELQEWVGGYGYYIPTKSTRIIISKNNPILEDTSAILAEDIENILGFSPAIYEGTQNDLLPGDIYLSSDNALSPLTDGLGAEGYACTISDKCVIAGAEKGILWGCKTLVQQLKSTGKIPCGIIRDYPKYSVRGFGLDVARMPISMDMLYRIVDEMSLYKLNDLQLHMNDNFILSHLEQPITEEAAIAAESSFRMESSIKNFAGQSITASDFYYSADELNALIIYARKRNIDVVPEIDTPAHSLSITSLYPEYMLKETPLTVDELDLSNPGAVDLAKEIWEEQLECGFKNAAIVNIGMDEYYGNKEKYRAYLNTISSQISASDKTTRFWGSLTMMDGKTKIEPIADNNKPMQMNIWSYIWANPVDMYEKGFHIINMQNNHLYIIPGSGYDHLNLMDLYDNWTVNYYYDDENNSVILPTYSSKLLGGAYMIWNDYAYETSSTLSENDIYLRFLEGSALLSDKMWKENNLIPLDDIQTISSNLN